MSIKYKPLGVEEESLKGKETSTPYIFELKNKSKRLICFGLEHTQDYNHEQFMKFDSILENIDSGIVLVEVDNIIFKEPKKKLLGELDYIIPRVEEKRLDIKGVDKMLPPCNRTLWHPAGTVFFEILKFFLLISKDKRDI
jgi:hypothetical protein